MRALLITCMTTFIVFIFLFWIMTPKCKDRFLLSSTAATGTTWASVTCTEKLFNTFALAQRAAPKVGDFVAARGNRFTVCKAVLSEPPACPACNCPACNCPAQKDCPACNCPAQKDCPACNCPAQKDCPACNCPDCVCPTLQPQPIEILLQGNVTRK